MTTIVVAFEATDSPGYKTPEEAIAAAMAHPLHAAARETASRLAGREFVRLWGSPEQWVLEFSGPVWLRVYPKGNQVGWAVERDRPDVPDAADPVAFEFDGGVRAEMDPTALSDARRGAAFWQLWANGYGFYVYLRRNLILSFSPVRRRDNGDWLLYAFEEV